MKSIFAIASIVVATVLCSVAEARPRVTIVRRQRIVERPQAVILQRPLHLVAPSVLVPQQQLFVPSQQLIIVR